MPVVTLLWISRTGSTLPINQADLLLLGLPVLTGSFLVIWLLAYGGDKRDRSLRWVSVFLFFLWAVPGFFFLGKVNSSLGAAESKDYYRKVLKAAESGLTGSSIRSGGSHRAVCHITVTPPLAGKDQFEVPRPVCRDFDIVKGGIKLSVSMGALGMAWIRDYAVIEDFPTYKERLGISDQEDVASLF